MAGFKVNFFLFILAVLEALLLVHIIYQRSKPCEVSISTDRPQSLALSDISTPYKKATQPHLNSSIPAAIMVMLPQPRWFKRRYSIMVQNVFNNIPEGWKIQIFHSEDKQTLAGIEMNPSIERFRELGVLILTPIPVSLLRVKPKRIQLMTDKWLWQNAIADRVLVFSGTTVICSNSPRKVTDFIHFDYLGAPWDSFHGLGGEGGISIRSRKLMLNVIDYELGKTKRSSTDSDEDLAEKQLEASMKWGYEDYFFVSRIAEMQKKGVVKPSQYRIASKNDSMTFAAFDNNYNERVWAVSGTLPRITYAERDKFITLCPEIKIFYPVLHDPHCFGASPEAEGCAKTICALKPKEERRGGC